MGGAPASLEAGTREGLERGVGCGAGRDGGSRCRRPPRSGPGRVSAEQRGRTEGSLRPKPCAPPAERSPGDGPGAGPSNRSGPEGAAGPAGPGRVPGSGPEDGTPPRVRACGRGAPSPGGDGRGARPGSLRDGAAAPPTDPPAFASITESRLACWHSAVRAPYLIPELCAFSISIRSALALRLVFLLLAEDI